MTTCNVIGCDAAPTHRAEIVIFAKSDKLHTPALGFLPLCVCDEHATEERANELLVPAGKQQIEEQFTKAGYARPDWTRSFVRWVPLASPLGAADGR